MNPEVDNVFMDLVDRLRGLTLARDTTHRAAIQPGEIFNGLAALWVALVFLANPASLASAAIAAALMGVMAPALWAALFGTIGIIQLSLIIVKWMHLTTGLHRSRLTVLFLSVAPWAALGMYILQAQPFSLAVGICVFAIIGAITALRGVQIHNGER